MRARDMHMTTVPCECISARGGHATGRYHALIGGRTSTVSWVNVRCEDLIQLNYSASLVALRKRK